MSGARKMAVAIPAYRRADLLQALLAVLPPDRVSRVYISIDGPRPGAEAEVAATLAAACKFEKQASFEVLVHALPENVGAAANVLGAVDWMLRFEELGAVLEDDCHPIPQFFDFINAALDEYSSAEEVWLACGTQVAPALLMDGNHVLSAYPLIWGWGTTRTKWRTARQQLDDAVQERGISWLWSHGLSSPAEHYWHGGLRRAAEGRSDAWDTPLVYAMRRSGALAVLPRTPLVSNTGDDARATHTADEGRWTRLTPIPISLPLRASSNRARAKIEHWLERELYGISPRHLLSTTARWLLDRLSAPTRPPLRLRLMRMNALLEDASAPSQTGT